MTGAWGFCSGLGSPISFFFLCKFVLATLCGFKAAERSDGLFCPTGGPETLVLTGSFEFAGQAYESPEKLKVNGKAVW
jgi:hypothetical protein